MPWSLPWLIDYVGAGVFGEDFGLDGLKRTALLDTLCHLFEQGLAPEHEELFVPVGE
jgi:hypothetical protein